MPSMIGPIVGLPDVEDAVVATIELWINEYLSEVESQGGLANGTITRPLSYSKTYDYDNWPKGQIPAVAVVCPGTIGQPERSSGNVGAWFDVEVDVIVSGQDELDARRAAGRYQTAIATLLEQQGSLRASGSEPFAQNTWFQGFKVELPEVENRTLAVGTASFHVFVNPIFNRLAGPANPPPITPAGNLPTVVPGGVNVSVVEAESLPPFS